MGQGTEKHVSTVTSDFEGCRLDLYLPTIFRDMTRSALKRHFERGGFTVNGKSVKLSHLLHTGDVVEATHPPKSEIQLLPHPLNLEIIYEDSHLLVINKPQGIAVHPGAGETQPTLVSGILAHCHQLSSIGQEMQRPGIVHRLDKDTSGLLVVAKTDQAHLGLAEQFKAKSNVREYVALLNGNLALPKTVVESYLTRDPEHRTRFKSLPVNEANTARHKVDRGLRWSKSEFFRECVYGERLTFARVKLYTGRTHQIRVHAQKLGAPVVGDPVYGQVQNLPKSFSPEVSFAIAAIKRQLLHAERLGFSHPVMQKYLEFSVDPPDDFAQILKLLSPYAHK